MNPIPNDGENPSNDNTSLTGSSEYSAPSRSENEPTTVVLRSRVPIERPQSADSPSHDSSGPRWLRVQNDHGKSYLDRKTGERSFRSGFVDQRRSSLYSTIIESVPVVCSANPTVANPLDAASQLSNGRFGEHNQKDSTNPRWLRYHYDGDEMYVDQKTGEQWVLTTDSNGIPYYYQVNSERSVWELEDIGNCKDADPSEHSSQTSSNVDSTPTKRRTFAATPATHAPTQRLSMLDLNRQPPVINEPAQVPCEDSRLFDVTRMKKEYISGPQENKLAHFERRGLAKYAKITTNDRRVKKRWSDCLLVLSGPWFLIYKDNKSATPKPNNPYGKPEAKLHVQLIEPSDATESETSKEHVLKIEQKDARGISTAYLIQMPPNVIVCWKAAIRYAQQLMEEEKLLTPSLARDTLKNFLKPPSKLDNGILSKMLEFFRSRPSPEALRSRGILKNEPVFASTLIQICESENSDVPRFVVCAVRAIEARGLDHLGLYRISANAATVQKLRCCVNQYNYSLNSDKWSLDVLAGALKLFFRELKEPLFTFNAFSKIAALFASNKPDSEMVGLFRSILDSMPTPHFVTARVLFHHLTRVQEHAEQNQMHIHKLALVFGPSLLRSETDTESLAMLTNVQAPCVDFCLTHVVDLFGPVVPPPVVV
ncbi:Rho GTPase-activating protein 27 [Clonorchis sinensis]|uniref:Rho GTPase-activating protein 27 n=1 Tax=Clonorchis sinensis TaxID=79923 RepID=A0A8T1MZQ6_CLOSI|nr:Rho GTPase-activating protein 27 [Clonorchis sinensis]